MSELLKKLNGSIASDLSRVLAEELSNIEEPEPEMLAEHEAYDMYDDMLDDAYGTVTIAGMEYDTSRALKECDPIAYRVGFSDYADSLAQDGTPVEGYV